MLQAPDCLVLVALLNIGEVVTTIYFSLVLPHTSGCEDNKYDIGIDKTACK